MTTRRQKLEAMAAQKESPAEAKVAKRKLAKLPVTPEDRLASIAAEVRTEYDRSVDSQFAIGRLLAEARTLMPSDKEYSAWLKQEKFSFSYKTAYYLRLGAEREPEVRQYIEDRPEGSRDIGVTSVVKYLLDGKPAQPAVPNDQLPEPIATVDQSFAALRTARNLILGIEVGEDGKDAATGNAFLNMHVDDLTASAGYIKALATAYNEAKAARS